MFRNYLTVAARNLLKHRLYSAINIFGLAVGLAGCILILLFVRDELSYDRWIPDAERIYRVHTRFDVPGREPLLAQTAPGPTMAAMEKDFSDIDAAVRLLGQRPVMKRGVENFYEEVALADPSFFKVFDMPLVSGDPATALADPNALVISESMARKYFGDKPAIGQVIPAIYGWGAKDYHVTAVMKDLPDNTHLDIQFLAPLHAPDFAKMPWYLDNWTSVNTWLYFKLKPGADVEAIAKGLPEFEKRNIPNENIGTQEFKVADFIQFSIIPLTEVYLRPYGIGSMRPSGDITAVATFSVVALMILLIACINFTNLATARASQRAREVALRKVVGAHRPQLITQFLGESVLLAVIALVLAIAAIELVLPTYNTFLQKELEFTLFGEGGLAFYLLGLIALVGIVSGLYPAVYLSRFLPARILKANKSAAAEGSGRLRSALVVIQFAISIGLTICTAIVYTQTVYARNADLGFNQHGLLAVRGIGREPASVVSDSLKQEMARIPGVMAVTRAGEAPGEEDEDNTIIDIPGQVSAEPIVIGEFSVDYDFFSTFEIKVLAGRALSEEFGADDMSGPPKELADRGGNIVINQQALKRLGLTKPEEAIGKQFRMAVGPGEGDETQELMAMVTVVGVIADVQWQSARSQIRPMLYRHVKKDFGYLHVRFQGSPEQTQRAAEGVWRELVPEQPFFSLLLEDTLAALYDRDEARGQMFAAFAGLAIIIACLGLFGLASFTAERRTKEIGIRKVVGAKVRDVVRLMAWDFSKPVLIANILAWPVAWWLMRDWLDTFQNRIDINPAFFAAAGALALAVALGTVAGHAFRVARSNPIHALRYE